MKLEFILKDLMKMRGVTLSELLKVTGVPKQTIHNWLCDTELKALNHLRAIAKFFDISIEELCFGGEKEKHKSNTANLIEEHEEEIRAGIFEVVLRRVRRESG